jgi:methylated-DNA-[protein]-cysteine S-methyltransferase
MPFALFATSLGHCGIAWSDDGITHIRLPEASVEETRRRVGAESGEAESASFPAWVSAAMKLLARHLEGAPQDLRSIRLDTSDVPAFYARVYAESRNIGPGETLGYGELAARAGSPKGFRAVGQAMAKNPFPLVVPCHRVLASGGKPGGFSAYGGEETKRKILALEGVRLGGRSETLSLFEGDAAHGLLFDPEEAARALAGADRALAKIIDRVGPLRLRVESIQTPFQALAESIVYQQLTGKAAATILGRVHAIYGGRKHFKPEAAAATKDELLRAAGLSGAKTAALKDLAAKTLDGTVPSARALARASDEEIVERLTAVRGVGRWTVEMLLIFRLGRPDVLPVDDYGVRKGFQRIVRAKELPTRADLAKRGERWRPFRSAASWYLWRACELPPDAKRAARSAHEA